MPDDMKVWNVVLRQVSAKIIPDIQQQRVVFSRLDGSQNDKIRPRRNFALGIGRGRLWQVSSQWRDLTAGPRPPALEPVFGAFPGDVRIVDNPVAHAPGKPHGPGKPALNLRSGEFGEIERDHVVYQKRHAGHAGAANCP